MGVLTTKAKLADEMQSDVGGVGATASKATSSKKVIVVDDDDDDPVPENFGRPVRPQFYLRPFRLSTSHGSHPTREETRVINELRSCTSTRPRLAARTATRLISRSATMTGDALPRLSLRPCWKCFVWKRLLKIYLLSNEQWRYLRSGRVEFLATWLQNRPTFDLARTACFVFPVFIEPMSEGEAGYWKLVLLKPDHGVATLSVLDSLSEGQVVGVSAGTEAAAATFLAAIRSPYRRVRCGALASNPQSNKIDCGVYALGNLLELMREQRELFGVSEEERVREAHQLSPSLLDSSHISVDF
ncbi:hypothetical protein M427DRAFT_133925 [Gonapodya prolifera JEL478]|uniref:Uncharacterized protein n=1 Tax=Gonapodya prolifera (strain JEL478) TaxID=1344416 RepID=A0A139AJZ8_GONPJ|nr:hypothetical protein M427DRAFT_133925 [Gonapodya prolifera JEL478]|eukprot:KXS16874.1 hypothetical protein M427DRAFT_133925 [Gonapodya prolifera JEL478]